MVNKKEWNQIKDYTGQQKVEAEWRKSIINNVFGGEENLEKLIKDYLASSEIKDASHKLNEQEIAKLILKNINTEGYERSDCLKILRNHIWKIKKEEEKRKLEKEKLEKEDDQSLIEKAREDWDKEAGRSGFSDGESLEKFLKEN